MRLLAILFLVFSIAAATLTSTVICALSNFSEDIEGISLEALIRGNAHHMFFAPGVLRQYPSFASSGAYLDWTVLLFTGLSAAGVIRVARVWRQARWLLVGTLCLLIPIPAYLAGTIALWNNTIPEHAGPWLSTMYLGILYTSLLCAACALLEVFPDAPRWLRSIALQRRPRPHATT